MLNESATRAVAAQVVDNIRAKVAAEEWMVELGTISPPRFSIRFEHPLTSEAALSLNAEAKTLTDVVEQFLGRPEFQRIRSAPDVAPHAVLMRAIRENASGMDWPVSVVERLAYILGRQGVLTAGVDSLGRVLL